MSERAQIPSLRKVSPARGFPTTSSPLPAGLSGGDIEHDAEARAPGFERASSDLFAILWHALADVLGTAGTAALLRRAAQRGCLKAPELAKLAITRGALEYEYTVPVAWRNPQREAAPALCELVRALWPLLVDLTGSVVVNRLVRTPGLRASGILPDVGERP